MCQATRAVLGFLLEAMPKEEGEAVEEVLGQNVIRNRIITSTLQSWAQKSWLPASCARARLCPRRMKTIPIVTPEDSASTARGAYYASSFLPVTTRQASHRGDSVNSILEATNTALFANVDFDGMEGSSGTATKLSQSALAAALAEASRKKATWGVEDNYGLGFGGGPGGGSIFSRAAEFGQERPTGHAIGGWRPEGGGEQGADAGEEEAAKPSGPTREELAKQREEEVATLSQALTDWQTTILAVERSIEQKKLQTKKLESDLVEEESESEQLRNDYRVKKRMFELLPDVENNLQQLRAISAESAKKVMSLASEWESHRRPLVEEYRSKKEDLGGRRADFKNKVEKIQKMRRDMKEMIKDLQTKEQRYKSLIEEFEKLPKNLNRGTFISRISEMVNKVRKHDGMINTHLVETREVQRKINAENQRLGRTFAVTSEKIFRDAKQDEMAKAGYKHVAETHQLFEKVMDHLEDQQRADHEKFLLEKNIDSVKAQNYDLAKVQKDIKQVKAENKALAKALK